MENNKVTTIGSRAELFIDDALISELDNAQLRLNKPIRKEIILEMNEPWEGPGSGVYNTVFSDGKKYHMYYRAISPENSRGDIGESQFLCYAQSTDGIKWVKPDLRLFNYNGSTNNNILMGGIECHNFSPWIDTNPDCSVDEKYKAVSGKLEIGGLFAFKSADGFNWVKMKETPIITDGAFDSHNIWFWDTNSSVYRCYFRYWSEGKYVGIRGIQSSTSADFYNWTESVNNEYNGNVPMEHFYTSAVTLCPGAEHHYLSFPMRFSPDRKKWDDYPHIGVSDAIFMSSRDGVNFDRTFMEAWITPDIDPRNWTQRSNMPSAGILETSDEEFSLYVSEHYCWEDSRIRRYSVRRHGFGSVYADYKGGQLTTNPVIFEGDSLYINYATSAVGGIRVSIIDTQTNKTIDGFSFDDCGIIYGNELKKKVPWNNSLSHLQGKPIKLVFELTDADLFSMQFGFSK